MHEGNALPLRPNAGRLVDQADSGGAAAIQGAVQICRRKADVMYAGAASVDEFSDRRVRGCRLEQLDQSVAGAQAGNGGAVGVVERHNWQAEHIAVEWQGAGQVADGYPDMGEDRRLCGAMG